MKSHIYLCSSAQFFKYFSVSEHIPAHESLLPFISVAAYYFGLLDLPWGAISSGQYFIVVMGTDFVKQPGF